MDMTIELELHVFLRSSIMIKHLKVPSLCWMKHNQNENEITLRFIEQGLSIIKCFIIHT
jgi:hypothetical protein